MEILFDLIGHNFTLLLWFYFRGFLQKLYGRFSALAAHIYVKRL